MKREEVKRKLQDLKGLEGYQNEDVWRSAVVLFAARCALRLYPFYGDWSGAYEVSKGSDDRGIVIVERALYSALLAAQNKPNDLARRICKAAAYAGAYANAAAYVGAAAAAYAAYADAAAYVAAAAADVADAADADAAAADVADVADVAAANSKDLEYLEKGQTILNKPLYLESRENISVIQDFKKKAKEEQYSVCFERFEVLLEGELDLVEHRKLVLAWARSHPKLKDDLEGREDDEIFPLDKVHLASKSEPEDAEEAIKKPQLGAHGRAMSGSATEDDYLGYRNLTRPMAVYLSNEETDTPMNLSIEGEWGCGKSSFMKMLREDLHKEGKERGKKTKTVWFNPWAYKEGDEQWSAFIACFVDGVEAEMTKEELRQSRKTYFFEATSEGKWRRLTILLVPLVLGLTAYWIRGLLISEAMKDLVSALGLVMSIGGGALIVYKSFKAYVNSLKADAAKVITAKSLAARSSEIKRFSGLFHAFLSSHLKWKKDDEEEEKVCEERVYVFIDDLDRCAAPKAADLLDSIQLLLTDLSMEEKKSCPVVFILGIDREKVAAGVAVKHERVLPYLNKGVKEESRLESGRLFGYDYLQKFIDVPFHIPRPGENDVEKYIDILAPLDERVAEDESREAGEGSAVEDARTEGSGGESPALEPTNEDQPPKPKFDEKQKPSGSGEVTLEQTEEEREKQRKAILESPELRKALKKVAPLLGNNPRRLKHYLNLLRLRVFIVADNGFIEKIGLDKLATMTMIEIGRPTLYKRLFDSEEFRNNVVDWINEGKVKEGEFAESEDGKWLVVHASILASDLDGKKYAKGEGLDVQSMKRLLHLS